MIQTELKTQTTPVRAEHDIAIVGAGIIGLATARELVKRFPELSIVIVEKEEQVASHQSGHNSGVLHAGIYYKPGSLKAQACVAGRREMVAYCEEKGIPFRLCGKLIVALSEAEVSRLETLYERGLANGVPDLALVPSERIKEIEPYAAGVRAIWSPHTGIVDYVQVAQAFGYEVVEAGGEIVTGLQITGFETGADRIVMKGRIRDGSIVEISARFVITCSGLHADRVARLSGSDGDIHIVPFRGDYYALVPEKRHMVKGLIYPLPDPQFPFLGVHFTRTMSDEVWAGPNAVLAFAREGYRRWDVNLRDLGEVLGFGGFWKLAARHWRMGAMEMVRDYVKAAYVKEMQKYIPAISGADVVQGPSGVRAQALTQDGSLVDDFLITYHDRIAHIQNAPSPAATSSIIIARMIVEEVSKRFNITSRSMPV